MLKVRELPDFLQKIAIEELNEVPERIPEDIKALKTWIKQQTHLNARTDDQFLLSFLRGCKFSLEKAKLKIEKFYTLRTKYPQFYTIQNVNDPRVLEIIRMGIGLYLPIPLNETGPRIRLIRPGIYPPNKFTMEEVMPLANTFAIMTLHEDDHAIVNGFIDLMDMSQFTAAHLFQITPSLVKKLTTFSEEALPLRQKATHFINTGPGFGTFFNWLKPLMPAKQQNRLFAHGSMEDLHQHIPLKYLPKEYGGENSSLKEIIAEAEKKFLEMREFLNDDLKYGTIEKLRTGKIADYDNIFGIEGSFRKIMVD